MKLYVGKMFPFSRMLAILFACILIKEMRLYSLTTINGTKYLPDTSEALQHPFLEIENPNTKALELAKLIKTLEQLSM